MQDQFKEPLGTEQISVLSKSVKEEERVKVQERVLQMQEIKEEQMDENYQSSKKSPQRIKRG